MTTKHLTCEDRIDARLAGRLVDVARLWQAYCNGDDEGPEDLGHLYDYGLCFDYVEPGTFNDQRYGYWTWQLSCGGPSDEFRLHPGGRVEYRFHDWYDGAGRWVDEVDPGEVDAESVDPADLLEAVFGCFLEGVENRHGF